MSFPTQNNFVTIQVLLQNPGIRWVVMKSTIRRTVWLMLVAMLLATTACNSANDSTTMQPDENVPSEDSKPTTISANNVPYFFPQQEAVDGEREAMTAEIFGTLVVVDDCIRVNDNESGTSYLLVWPPDFTLITDNDTIQILNGDDEVVARVGDKVRIDGGEIKSLSFFNESMQKKLPPNCLAPYWIVGYEVNTLEISE